MRFFVLGPLEVQSSDGERHPISSAKQRALLAMLLARAGSVVTTDELIDGMWGDDPPASAVQSLRTYVSRLRKLLGDRIVGHDDGYSLDRAGSEIDSDTFEREVANRRYSSALGHWRGRPYGDAADLPTVRNEVVRLESLAAIARSGLAGEHLDAGNLAEAIASGEAAVADDPVNEAVWAALIRALSRSGRTADALRTYQRAVHGLAEAGLEPGSDLRAAESDALSTEPAPSAPRRRLPPEPLTSLVGRDADLEALERLTSERRLVTIVGPGGVGKTSLALAVARRVAERHRLGARVVELARISEADAISPAIRRALDLTEGGSGSSDGLGSVDALLVLDNCEHMIDAVADRVVPLLTGGAALHVLVTSREPLAITGEHRWPLDPLPIEGADAPALALFVERAREVGVDVDPRDPLAQDTVVRLDGLPLAVEMAAARLATMGLADLVVELERSTASLASDDRRAADRHSTLRAVLAWSEALMEPRLRTALAEFSVFAGRVGAVDLAAAMTDGSPMEAVSALAKRSLVTVDTSIDGRARYGSLATVRDFGRERLDESGRILEVARRHATWFTEAAEETAAMFDSVDEAVAVARIDAALDEMRAAHLWSRTHDPGLARRLSDALFLPAYQGLRLEVFEWSLSLAENMDPDDEGAAMQFAQVAAGLTLFGRLPEAARWAERSIAASSDPHQSRLAHSALADVAVYTGDLERAAEHAREHDRLAEHAGNTIERAIGKATLAVPLSYLGRLDEALETITREPEAGAPPSARAWLAYGHGEVLLDRDPEAALRQLDVAIALAESVDNRYVSAVAHVSAATLRLRTGRPDEAIEPFIRTIERLADRANLTHLLTTLRNLPTLLVGLDEWRATAEILGGVSTASITPTYGDEAERLSEAETAARSKLGEDDHAEAFRIGGERDLLATARYALSVLGTHAPAG